MFNEYSRDIIIVLFALLVLFLLGAALEMARILARTAVAALRAVVGMLGAIVLVTVISALIVLVLVR
jgi:hypothetical protein